MNDLIEHGFLTDVIYSTQGEEWDLHYLSGEEEDPDRWGDWMSLIGTILAMTESWWGIEVIHQSHNATCVSNEAWSNFTPLVDGEHLHRSHTTTLQQRGRNSLDILHAETPWFLSPFWSGRLSSVFPCIFWLKMSADVRSNEKTSLNTTHSITYFSEVWEFG